MKAIIKVIIISIIAVLVTGQINAQNVASHRMLLIPTASPVPNRVASGVHIFTTPTIPVIVPQITIPFGTQVGALFYFGGGFYKKTLMGLGSAAIKYSPFVPDSSRFGVGIIAQAVIVGVAHGVIGATGLTSIQFIGSSPIKMAQIHAGLMFYNNEDWNISPLIGVNFSIIKQIQLLAEFMIYRLGPYSNLQYFLFSGLRVAIKNVTIDIGTGISLERSESDQELRRFWFPPIVAITGKF